MINKTVPHYGVSYLCVLFLFVVMAASMVLSYLMEGSLVSEPSLYFIISTILITCPMVFILDRLKAIEIDVMRESVKMA